jgi:hypothetical protein
MFLQNKQSGVLVKILDPEVLFNPVEHQVPGRIQAGEEEQEPEKFPKENLIFPSGETLPRCWTDADYRDVM